MMGQLVLFLQGVANQAQSTQDKQCVDAIGISGIGGSARGRAWLRGARGGGTA